MSNARRTLTVAACCLTIWNGEAVLAHTTVPGAVTVPVRSKTLVYYGRWDRRDPSVAHSHWGGAYLRTRFTGTSVGLKMQDDEDLVVSIDGEPFRPVAGRQGVTPLNLAPLPPGLHALLVGSAAGGEVKVEGIMLDPGAVTKPPVPRPIIEFIGDSITWGTGPEHFYNVNHAWMAAEAVNCDHTQVAQPARALTTGYGCADEKTGMDRQYFRLKNFGYATEKPAVLWDFSTYTPDIVVINLGQNDGCGNEPDETFTASYIQFVQNVRAKFPKAQIVALRMYGGGRFGEDTRKAAAVLKADGDTRVHFIDTAGWLDSKADMYDGVHPNAQGNLKAAMHLAPLLMPLLPAKAQVSASPATVGDPKNPAGLAQALQNAYLRGERRIVVTPGTYTLTQAGEGANVSLDHWQDAELNARHVTFILDNQKTQGRLFQLEHCTHVTLAGPLLTQTAQPAYQGRVMAVGKDADGKPYCDWQPSAGYPVPAVDGKDFWINVVDARTRTINLRAGDYYHTRLEPLGGGTFRIHLNEDRPLFFAVGDWIVARDGSPPTKVFLSSCRACTLKDVTMTRNGFAPIFDGEGDGNRILRCHWARGPRPVGATEDPVVTNAADGIHSPDAHVGPDIEDCTFDGVFLDDCIAIHGGFHKVVSVNGPVVVTRNEYAFYHVGEPVRISNDKGFYLQANVTALQDNGDGTSTLTLGTTEVVPPNTCMSNPLYDGRGYKIIGCRLGNTRSRGIIVKSDDGVIQNNVITHCGLGVAIGPEWPQEADYCHNVLVEGNTFSHNNDALSVNGAGAMQNRAITIRNNQFVSNRRRDIAIAWADGVTLQHNTFSALPAPTGAEPRSPLAVHDAQNIAVGDSHILTPEAYALPKP